MNTITVRGQSGNSTYIMGPTQESLYSLVGDRRAVVLTDSTVHRLHGKRFGGWPTLVIEPGEDQKSLRSVSQLYQSLMEMHVDRSTLLIGVGGGVVCDITGFVAATYLRGLPCGFVPTTLLAQVDAAIGGKNAVNLDGYKNLVGTFRQPEFILCDSAFLHTLPESQLRGGFAEIIKAAAIADPSLLGILVSKRTDLQNRNEADLRTVIHVAARIKVDIVNDDETEQGERRKLNFGHTLGHALEKVLALPHGDAVAIGMSFAADLSVRRSLLQAGDAGYLRSLIASFGLPTELPTGHKAALLDAISQDKKRDNDQIHMILLRSLGEAIDVLIGLDELQGAIT